MQVFRIDLWVLQHEGFHLDGDRSLDLNLLTVGHVVNYGVFTEKVAHEDLFNVALVFIRPGGGRYSRALAVD